jgi:nitroreductase
MDASTSLSREAFFNLLMRLVDQGRNIPFSLLPWDPFVSLLIFVHRVEGLAGGMYLLVRNPEHLNAFQDSLRPEFLWEKTVDCPESLPFYLLAAGDCRNAAKMISCHQSIAEDGAFSLGMLAHFEPALREFGACYYRRFHWECGLIGQMLYLEAEAAGISGTGIGCFHDDVLHRFIGLEDRTWQTLYHFTVGKALEDLRLQTIPAYHHL